MSFLICMYVIHQIPTVQYAEVDVNNKTEATVTQEVSALFM